MTSRIVVRATGSRLYTPRVVRRSTVAVLLLALLCVFGTTAVVAQDATSSAAAAAAAATTTTSTTGSAAAATASVGATTTPVTTTATPVVTSASGSAATGSTSTGSATVTTTPTTTTATPTATTATPTTTTTATSTSGASTLTATSESVASSSGATTTTTDSSAATPSTTSSSSSKGSSSSSTDVSTSSASSSSSSTVTVALVMVGAVAAVMGIAMFVHSKTQQRDALDRKPLGSMNSTSSQAHRSYDDMESPQNELENSKIGAPPSSLMAQSRVGGGNGASRVRTSSKEAIDLHDPNVDVLTPLSDIATTNAFGVSSFGASLNGNNQFAAHSNDNDYNDIDNFKEQYPSGVFSVQSNDFGSVADDYEGDTVTDTSVPGLYRESDTSEWSVGSVDYAANASLNENAIDIAEEDDNNYSPKYSTFSRDSESSVIRFESEFEAGRFQSESNSEYSVGDGYRDTSLSSRDSAMEDSHEHLVDLTGPTGHDDAKEIAL